MKLLILWGGRARAIWRLVQEYRQRHGGKAGLLRLATRVYLCVTKEGLGGLGSRLNIYLGQYLDSSRIPGTPDPTNILSLDPMDLAGTRSIRNVAVHAHIYYKDLAPELRRYLGNIPVPFHLYLTTDAADKATEIKAAFAGMKNIRGIDVLIVPNRGRDIGPMIVALGDTLSHNEIVLHIHTKRSPHNPELRGWRRYLLQSLLGSPSTVAAILNRFDEDPRLGVLYPQTYWPVLPFMRIGGNGAAMNSLLKRVGQFSVKIENIDTSAFPTGFMFWFRGNVIEPFNRMSLSFEDFEPETGQVDGTLAHAIERTFCYVASLKEFGQKPFLPKHMFSRSHIGALPMAELFKVLGESDPRVHIIFDHNIGGGANRYSRDLVSRIIADGSNVLRVYYADNAWFSEWIAFDDGMVFVETEVDTLFGILAEISNTGITVNSLYMYPNIDHVTESIVNLAASSGASVDYKVHDFYAICPSQHLLDADQRYCSVPKNLHVCTACLRKNEAAHWTSSRAVDIVKWREPFSRLLKTASKISAFDPSSVDILRQAFDVEEAKVNIAPHVHPSFKNIQPVRLAGTLHIGTFGTLTEAKGSAIINNLANHIARNRLHIPLTVVGRSVAPTAPGIRVLGAYELENLAEIVQRERINVFLMASIIPETFSYTISEAMQMKLPIIAFDIGAQGRRVKAYKWGRVVPIHITSEDLLKVIKEVHLSSTMETC
jgi:glycosyltransferase involved in cell wall biosynthesis